MRFGPVAKISLILLACMLIVRAATVQEPKVWLSAAMALPVGLSLIGEHLVRLGDPLAPVPGGEIPALPVQSGAPVQAALAESSQ